MIKIKLISKCKACTIFVLIYTPYNIILKKLLKKKKNAHRSLIIYALIIYIIIQKYVSYKALKTSVYIRKYITLYCFGNKMSRIINSNAGLTSMVHVHNLP